MTHSSMAGVWLWEARGVLRDPLGLKFFLALALQAATIPLAPVPVATTFTERASNTNMCCCWPSDKYMRC